MEERRQRKREWQPRENEREGRGEKHRAGATGVPGHSAISSLKRTTLFKPKTFGTKLSMKLNALFVLLAFAMHAALVVAIDNTPSPVPTEVIAVPTPAATNLASVDGLDAGAQEKITIDRNGAFRFMFERPRPVDGANVKHEPRTPSPAPASKTPAAPRRLRFRADA